MPPKRLGAGACEAAAGAGAAVLDGLVFSDLRAGRESRPLQGDGRADRRHEHRRVPVRHGRGLQARRRARLLRDAVLRRSRTSIADAEHVAVGLRGRRDRLAADKVGDAGVFFAGAAALGLVGDVGLVGEVHRHPSRRAVAHQPAAAGAGAVDLGRRPRLPLAGRVLLRPGLHDARPGSADDPRDRPSAGNHAGPGVFNAGTDRFGTMREGLEALCAHAGTGSHVRSLPARPAAWGMKVAAAAHLA